MKEFKIRVSAIGKIMGGAEITEIQLKKIQSLEEKEKRTEKQQEELDRLIHKRDNPELSATAKTYCRDWLMEQLYSRRKEFSSKYTQKGNIVEDNSIDFIAKTLDLGLLFKNEDFYENEYIQGTPDVILPNFIIDAKNSWDFSTFPYLEKEIPNSDYWWQGQGYMTLCNKKSYKLIYCLTDTPENLIEREARRWCYDNGYEELDEDIYDKFYEKMTYSDLPDYMKIKVYDFERCDESILKIIEKVKQCREYIKTLL